MQTTTKIVTCLWLATQAAPGQALFRDLAAAPSGNELYFVSSLRLRGSTQPLHGKLFRLTEAGVELVASRPVPELVDTGLLTSQSYFVLSRPFLNPAGNLTGYVLERDCTGGSICNSIRWGTHVRGQDLGETLAFTITGNGRYVGFTSRQGLGPVRYGARDLDEPSRSFTSLNVLASRQFVTPDGHLVYEAGGRIYREREAAQEVAAEPFGGNTVAHPEQSGALVTGESLRWFDARTGRFRVLAEQRCEDAKWAGGDWFVASCGGRLWRGELTRGGPLTAIALEAAALNGTQREWVAARRGEVIWFRGADEGLYRYDAASGEARRALGAPAMVVQPVPFLAPGRVVVFRGSSLPDSPGDLRVWIDRLPTPVLALTTGEFALQVPWEARRGRVEWRHEMPVADSAFEPAMLAGVDIGGAAFDSEAILADWSGYVSRARPGDLVHFYGTGFGVPVDPPMLGTAAPLDRAVPLRDAVRCTTDETPAREVRVVWAGLAPGFVGFQQLTLETVRWQPAPGVTGSLAVQCNGARTIIRMVAE